MKDEAEKEEREREQLIQGDGQVLFHHVYYHYRMGILRSRTA